MTATIHDDSTTAMTYASANETDEERTHAQAAALSEDDWNRILEQYDHLCLGCGRRETEIDPDPTQRRRLVPNLILPAERGGTAHVENVQPLCPACHERKADQWVDFRRLWPGFFLTHASWAEAQTASCRGKASSPDSAREDMPA